MSDAQKAQETPTPQAETGKVMRNAFLDNLADLLKCQTEIMGEALTPQTRDSRDENMRPMKVRRGELFDKVVACYDSAVSLALAESAETMATLKRELEGANKSRDALREAIRQRWAIDTEDGLMCNFCGRDIEVDEEHFEANAHDIISHMVPYTCEHSDKCIVPRAL